MKIRYERLLLLLAFTCLLPKMHAQAPTAAHDPASRPEEIEWTWEVRPSHVDRTLPTFSWSAIPSPGITTLKRSANLPPSRMFICLPPRRPLEIHARPAIG